MRLPAAATVLLLAVSTLASAQSTKPTRAEPLPTGAKAVRTRMIQVSEGTNMQVTVSPNRATLLMNLQGLIYSMPLSGGMARQLTGPYDEASYPDWSAKGGVVAIQSYANGTYHIWTMRPDGTGLRQITQGHGDDREPKISPDGKSIAFSSDRAFRGSYDIWTVEIATGALKQITSGEDDEYEPTGRLTDRRWFSRVGKGTRPRTLKLSTWPRVRSVW